MTHEVVEKNVGLLIVLTLLVISVAGLVQIVPLYFVHAVQEEHGSATKPLPGLEPFTALQLEGRDVYIREGCNNCHSQQIRPFRAETERYGHYSVIGESAYNHPFLWGSKRTGPDLARVGGRYSDDWHRVHLINPRDVVPESNMPAYPWLAENVIDETMTPRKLRAMQTLGVPYTEDDVAGAADAVKGKTEMDAMVAYLQVLGTYLDK